jgi:hypothetical protein
MGSMTSRRSKAALQLFKAHDQSDNLQIIKVLLLPCQTFSQNRCHFTTAYPPVVPLYHSGVRRLTPPPGHWRSDPHPRPPLPPGLQGPAAHQCRSSSKHRWGEARRGSANRTEPCVKERMLKGVQELLPSWFTAALGMLATSLNMYGPI